MDLVVSLGGAVITDAVEDGDLDRYVAALEEVGEDVDTLVVVTGAGSLKRYIDAADAFDVSEAWKDLVGIRATRLHATTLASALDANVPVPDDLESVAEMAEVHDIIALGGLVPGQSTDAVAAECAEIIEADRLILATTVDGVYDADPEQDADAERYDELSYDDLVELVVEKETSAGSYALIDVLAAKLIQRSGIETAVLDGRDPSVLAAAAADQVPGTVIR
ncbi:MAG: UMP kinase [Candidatus Nanohaloarchaea archaeon]|nr:UMP kinase [Candidatus Nanohaloarchaea archaeon]